MTKLALAIAIACMAAPLSDLQAETISLIVKGRLFTKIETARTEQEQARGLMDRETLPEDAGMLFIQKRPRMLSFWMKNTKIPRYWNSE